MAKNRKSTTSRSKVTLKTANSTGVHQMSDAARRLWEKALELDPVESAKIVAQLDEPPFSPAKMAKVKARALEVLAAAFRAYWQGVLRDLKRGIDVPGRTHDYFLTSPKNALRQARAHYSMARARRFSAMSEQKVLEQIRPWADLAVDSALRSCWDDLRLAHKELRSTVRGEYVTYIDDHHHCSTNRPQAGYDDLYERTAAGHSVGATLRVFRQTGERFTHEQRRMAFFAIAREFEENAKDDDNAGHWRLALESGVSSEVLVLIWDTESYPEYRPPRGWRAEKAVSMKWPVMYL